MAERQGTQSSVIALAFAAMLLGACDGPRAEKTVEYRPTSANARAATEAETRRILTHPPDGLFQGLPDIGLEVFRSDGSYQRNGFPTVDGWYSVSGNEVCVAQVYNAPTTSCRRIMIGPDGPFQVWGAHDSARINSHVASLTEAKVRAAIVGMSIMPPAGSHDLPTKTFHVDGTYRSQGRGFTTGTYSIAGHRVCLSVGSVTPDCWYLYDVGGLLMISDAASPELVTSRNMWPLRTRRERSHQAGDGPPLSR